MKFKRIRERESKMRCLVNCFSLIEYDWVLISMFLHFYKLEILIENCEFVMIVLKQDN